MITEESSARKLFLTKSERCDIMPIKDRNGCLHSEANGRFISKNDTDKLKKLERVYNTHGHLNETEQEAAPLNQDDRVSKNIEYAVPHGLLQKREYKDKFFLMDSDSQTADKFYGIAKEILEHRGGTNGEDIYLYDPISKEIGKGTSGEIAYHPEYDDELKKWFLKHPRNLIAFHNHARNSPPSFDDIVSASLRGYSKGFVLCHNGTIYEYTASSEDFDPKIYEEAIRSHNFETNPELIFTDYGFYVKEVRRYVKKRK